ncbi:MAG: glycosyltransferase family 4 protein [candidate division Zixibacteria bacterium]|nr:glycosyltransferase family 4 protein [candidate division Zixibacteria bacterium]
MTSNAAVLNSSRCATRPLLFVSSGKFWSGTEQWFLQCATALREREWEIHVAGRRGGWFLPRVAAAGLPTFSLKFRSDLSVPDFLRLSTWIRKHRPACVLCNLPRDVRVAGSAARTVRGTKVFWIVGLGSLRDRWRDRFYAGHCVDRFVVPSRSLAGELEALGYIDPARIDVLPIGLDLKRWPRTMPADSTHPPTVAVIARLSPLKGHEVLLKAWPEIQRAVPAARLWIVGTGPEEDTLRAMAGPHGDQITFWGHVSGVRAMMPEVDIVVQPSRYEVFGIALLEAMASRKPIVCTDVGGMVEVVDSQCALIVPPSNPAALAQAIAGLLNDPVRAMRMGQAGRDRLERLFTLDQMIVGLEALIRMHCA